MTLLGAAHTHTLWLIALGVGAVLVVVLIVVAMRLVAFLKGLQARAAGLVAARDRMATDTARRHRPDAPGSGSTKTSDQPPAPDEGSSEPAR